MVGHLNKLRERGLSHFSHVIDSGKWVCQSRRISWVTHAETGLSLLGSRSSRSPWQTQLPKLLSRWSKFCCFVCAKMPIGLNVSYSKHQFCQKPLSGSRKRRRNCFTQASGSSLGQPLTSRKVTRIDLLDKRTAKELLSPFTAVDSRRTHSLKHMCHVR